LAQLGALCISNLCATKPFESVKLSLRTIMGIDRDSTS